MPSRIAVSALVVLLALPHSLDAQCPNGGPPPCQQAPRPVPIDPKRIAILPFRVSTADTLFGEGLAELIASEFTGDAGPRALHMGSVLRSWRAAGGGPRAPLPQGAGRRVARDLGAAMAVEGAVIGLGTRLRLTASVVNVTDGSAKPIDPITGSADSLEALVGKLVSGLLAATGGARNASFGSRLTASPVAMRAYLEGLALWRVRNAPAAVAALERSWAADTLFAAAAFMRYRIANWQSVGDNNDVWADRVRAQRAQLSREDQLLAVAYLGEPGVAAGVPATVLANRRRVALLLPESPDAQYLLADYLWHRGGLAGSSNWLAEARALFERATQLDSLVPVVTHLMEIGLLVGDTALTRRAWGFLDRTSADPLTWSWGWLVGASLRDQQLLGVLRRPGSHRFPPILGAVRISQYGLPAAMTDEVLDLARQHRPDEAQNLQYFVATTVQGRPSTAARTPLTWPDASRRDVLIVLAALFADGDSARAADAMRRLESSLPSDTVRRGEAICALAHWQLRTSGRVDPAIPELLPSLRKLRCAAALSLLRGPSGDVLDALLPMADSVIRTDAEATTAISFGGFEHLVLARHWERRREYAKALAAVRARVRFLGLEWNLASSLRQEGRLAALAGDTAGAVAAYRHYLLIRRDAEPRLVPQRDSVVAELAALGRR